MTDPSPSAPPSLPLARLAEILGGIVEGDPEIPIRGVAGLDDAVPGSLVRVEHPRYLRRALASGASALLVPLDLEGVTLPCIRVENVRLAFLRCLELFAREELPPPGVHPTAVLGRNVELHPECHVGPCAVLGDGVRVGARAVLHAHVVAGDGCEIGEGSVLFPGVVLYPGTVVGARVRIHAGAVVGADGYGYEWDGSRHLKRPHHGRVRIGDDVEIGANTTIDRATTGETVIGPGTKIDNLVQIGHNVRTGAHCLIVAQTGLAGSVRLGNGVVLAGQVGVNPHVTIGDGVQVGGRSGVWGDVPPGQVVSGNPARPHREELRLRAALSSLSDLIRRVRELERQIEELRRSEG